MSSPDDREFYDEMMVLLHSMKEKKPKEPSGRARFYAVAVTMLEQMIAYFRVFVWLEEIDENGNQT